MPLRFLEAGAPETSDQYGTLLFPRSCLPSDMDISTLLCAINHSRFSSVEEKELSDICSRELQEANYP